MAVHLAVTGDVFDGVLFCAVLFPHEMSWMRSGTEVSHFLRIFLPSFEHGSIIWLRSDKNHKECFRKQQSIPTKLQNKLDQTT